MPSVGGAARPALAAVDGVTVAGVDAPGDVIAPDSAREFHFSNFFCSSELAVAWWTNKRAQHSERGALAAQLAAAGSKLDQTKTDHVLGRYSRQLNIEMVCCAPARPC